MAANRMREFTGTFILNQEHVGNEYEGAEHLQDHGLLPVLRFGVQVGEVFGVNGTVFLGLLDNLEEHVHGEEGADELRAYHH